MATKIKSVWYCTSCGNESPKWMGRCPACGEWNTMKIRLVGDNIQTWLNGEQMINFTDEKIGKGHGRICLQIHDGGGIKVLWRNIHIKTL